MCVRVCVCERVSFHFLLLPHVIGFISVVLCLCASISNKDPNILCFTYLNVYLMDSLVVFFSVCIYVFVFEHVGIPGVRGQHQVSSSGAVHFIF